MHTHTHTHPHTHMSDSVTPSFFAHMCSGLAVPSGRTAIPSISLAACVCCVCVCTLTRCKAGNASTRPCGNTAKSSSESFRKSTRPHRALSAATPPAAACTRVVCVSGLSVSLAGVMSASVPAYTDTHTHTGQGCADMCVYVYVCLTYMDVHRWCLWHRILSVFCWCGDVWLALFIRLCVCVCVCVYVFSHLVCPAMSVPVLPAQGATQRRTVLVWWQG